MIGDESTHTEIERDEAWLNNVLVDEPPAPLDRIKHRVRIEVNEAWFEQGARTETAVANLAAVKRALRSEAGSLARQREQAARRIRVWIGRLAGLAAAA
ncbi:MAG: hypothetical protein ABIG68_06375, partial [Acidobacteriota bacterium]